MGAKNPRAELLPILQQLFYHQLNSDKKEHIPWKKENKLSLRALEVMLYISLEIQNEDMFWGWKIISQRWNH